MYWCLFIIITFSLMVVMVNILQSLLNDAMDRNIGQRKIAENYEKLSLIYEIEKFIIPWIIWYNN